MSTATKPRRRMGIMTILSSIFILVAVIWATYTFILVQSGQVRQYDPHEELPVDPWPYNLNWAGGQADWFDNINYTDLPLDMDLPEDLLAHLNDTLFVVDPGDPPQLWHSSAYDTYDGAGWTKTLGNVQPFTNEISRNQSLAQGNTIYTVYMNVSAGASVGNIELPTLFPEIQIIEGSFQSNPAGLLTSYVLETDEYNTLLFSPLIQGSSEENVLISFDLTFTNQDLANVEATALPGAFASGYVSPAYLSNPTLSQNVTDDIAQFSDVGTDAYDKALAVDLYFRSNFQLIMDLSDRPSGQEVTEWFLERGGGLPMDFATAYCVYMRELGIPARMVTGYAVGDLDSGRRVIQVKHMMFWAEVFIPMSGHPQGGEWIQVVPIGLAGNEVPENTDPGDVQLYVFNPEGVPWALIGDSFNLTAILVHEGIPVTTPEQILFTDITDTVSMGQSTIEPGFLSGVPLPMANLTYSFPTGATVGNHIISASWLGPGFTVTNFTSIIAVGVANPIRAMSNSPISHSPESPGFTLSDTIDVDFSLGLDNYTAYWQDTVLAHGIMTVSGDPVDGTNLTNDQVQIMWDNIFVGNATIQSDGYYELSLLVDPSLFYMTIGQHEVWASYLGEFDPIYGYPIILPGRSLVNSTVDVWGKVSFTLSVDPDPAYGGATLTYSGTVTLLNGTPLDTESIEMYFNGTFVGSTTTNSSGQFEGTWLLPVDTPNAVYEARVRWVSGIPKITGNFSDPFMVSVTRDPTILTIDSVPKAPQAVHIFENITFSGFLTIQSNGSPLVGREIMIWWDTGTGPVNIVNATTVAGGYYEVNYTVPAGYEGSVDYWSEFPISDAVFQGSTSGVMTITVKKYDTIVSIDVDLNPVHIDESLVITGNVSLPELGGALLGGADIRIWWWNSSGPHNINETTTSLIDGQFTFTYPIPFNHEFAVFPIYAEFFTSSPQISGNQSTFLLLNVTNYGSTLDLYSNSTYYHLNETAHVWGQLRLDNGTPLAGETVFLYWNNGTDVIMTPKVTNISGWFDHYYTFSVANDAPAMINVTVTYTSATRLYTDGRNTIMFPAQLYQLTLSASTASPIAHLDEVIAFSGTLLFDEGSVPIVGATISITYEHSNGSFDYFSKFTNSTGGFFFQYNLSLTDLLGAVYLWASYTSTSPLLWEDASSLPASQVMLTKYLFDLSIASNGTSFHLDEVVHVWGRLTYQHNGTELAGQPIRVYWTNSTGQTVFEWYTTNSSGWFNFYYNISIFNDNTGPVSIFVTFVSGSQWWNDSSSSSLGFNLARYSFDLTITTDFASYYLDEIVHVSGQLTFQTNGTPLTNWPIRIYWDWNNGNPLAFYDGPTTDGSGNYAFDYNLTAGVDNPAIVTIWAEFTHANPLWNERNSTTTDITLLKRTSILFMIPTPNVQYLNESILFTASLILQNTTPITGVPISIWWDFQNSTVILLTTQATNGSGIVEWLFSGMDNYPPGAFQVYADWPGNALINGDASPQAVTVQRWATDITGFSTGGVIDYRPTETVPISGTLSYVTGPTPFGGILVRILVEGFEQGTALTQSDGSFSFNWYIPADTMTGSYDVTVSYVSSVNWIADFTTPAITLNIDAFDLDSSTFIVIPVVPTVLYLDGQLNISGILQLDNGTLYSGAEVYLYWNHANDASGPLLIRVAPLISAGDGSFQYVFTPDPSTPLGLADVWAEVTPAEAYITQWMSSVELIDIQQIPVNIVSDSSDVVRYRGDSLLIFGNLTFGNGTAMVGFDVILEWDGVQSNSTTITDAVDGYFEFSFSIEWDQDLGFISYRVFFDRPSVAFEAAEDSALIEIRDLVTINLDAPGVSYVVRGDDLIITGFVENGNGNVPGVPLEAFIDTNSEATGATQFDGTFQLTLPTSLAYSGGSHTITVDLQFGLFYDGTADSLSIDFHIATTLFVDFTRRRDVMPGETFRATIILLDDLGNTIPSTTLTFYLNGTEIQTVGPIDTTGTDSTVFRVGTDIDQSAFYILEVSYPGAGDFEPVSESTDDALHVFTQVYFDMAGTPALLSPGQSLTIRGSIYDAPVAQGGIPIVGRSLSISLNGTGTGSVATGLNGDFSYTVGTVRGEGHYDYQITLESPVTPFQSDPYRVDIQTGGPNMQLLDQLLPFIALAGAIVVVLLYLYFVRGMFRGPMISPTVDIPSKLRNIKKLADAGKYSAAITLAYRTFEQMCGTKIGSERLHSETAREYIERVLKSLPLDAASVEEFVQAYEEARFSDHEITRERYELAIKIFTDLYPRIERTTTTVPTAET